MVTAQQVYDLSLVLIDEVSESGTFAPDNPEYYKKKSLSFLTMLQTEISGEAFVFTNMDQELAMSDRVALTVIPYGLAAHLLMSEKPSLASFLNARYDELKRKLPTSSESIEDVYDIIGSMQ